LVPDATSGALVEREVAPERRSTRCLTNDELVAVATMAKRAEKHYGCPQDIEFAFDRDLPAGSNLLLLQSRPETVHSSAAKTAATRQAPATGFSSMTAGLLGKKH
jgi:pyruvate,water dikinase